jgi:hypothetical protein
VARAIHERELSKSFWTRTTDTKWRHKSKISEKLGRCGRQNMLRPYLKIWNWDWIFRRAVKAISSLGVRSPCLWRIQVPTIANIHRRRKVHERVLVILAEHPGPKGQLSCLHSFKIVWPMKPSSTALLRLKKCYIDTPFFLIEVNWFLKRRIYLEANAFERKKNQIFSIQNNHLCFQTFKQNDNLSFHYPPLTYVHILQR